jgi:tetratricopeptide (TPR) repeat protein
MMNILKKSTFLIVIIFLTLQLSAQTVQEAGEKYNQGAEYYKAKDYTNAVLTFEQALKIADQVGPDANDLKTNIQTQLVNAYMREGLDLYKAKNFDAAIKDLEKSNKLATETGNTEMQAKTQSITSKIYAAKGNALLKEEKLDEALQSYTKATELQSTNLDALLGTGLVYKSIGNMDEMMKYMDMVVEYGSKNPDDAKTVQNAQTAASASLLNEAAKALQNKNGQKAVDYINDAFKYVPGDADAYSNLSVAYIQVKNWDEAAASANKALELQQGDKSNIYFQLGQALEGKGDAAGACAAYKQVTGGANAEAAKYQITQVLKCS